MRFVANNSVVLGRLCKQTLVCYSRIKPDYLIWWTVFKTEHNSYVHEDLMKQQLKFQSIKSIKKLYHVFYKFAFEIGRGFESRQSIKNNEYP